ncbi:MAG: cyclic-di-AMP receptor [Anaerolineae bacterium]|nr:cyclic-di-AMP receptor [Anaerolineae bacterium]
MKLIIAIVRDTDNDIVSHALNESGFRVTCIASTGGLWRKGQSTLLIGVEDEKLEGALQIIRNNVTKPSENDSHHSTIFVLNVNQFSQI